MLQCGGVDKIAAQYKSTMLHQPLTRILKDKVVFAPDVFVAQCANLLRGCKEVEIGVNSNPFHFLSNSAS